MKYLFWICYFFLLGVLLPHTAWTFAQMEPAATYGLGWAAAIAFEIVIALLTYLLADNIASATAVGSGRWQRVRAELDNIPFYLLMLCLVVTVVANGTHAYEHIGQSTAATFQYAAVRIIYPILFGAALPIASFAFAYVLAGFGKKSKLVKPVDKADPVERCIDYILHREGGESGKPSPQELAEALEVPVSEVEAIYKAAVQRLVARFGGG